MKLWDKISGLFRKKPAAPDPSEPLRALDPETDLPAEMPAHRKIQAKLQSGVTRNLIYLFIVAALHKTGHEGKLGADVQYLLDQSVEWICHGIELFFGWRAMRARVTATKVMTKRGWLDLGPIIDQLPTLLPHLLKGAPSPVATPFALAEPEFPAKSFASPPRAAGDVLARVTAQPKMKRPVVLDDLEPAEAETAGRVAQSLAPDPERSAEELRLDALREALSDAGVFISDAGMAHAHKMLALGFRPDVIAAQVKTHFPAPEPKPAAQPKPKKRR